MSEVSFAFADCASSGTVAINTAALGTAYPFMDASIPTSVVSAYGTCIFLNGVNLNRKFIDPTAIVSGGGDGFWPLCANAPYGTITPTLGAVGAGRVYGRNYKWFMRFKASTTGEVTGFTETNPKPINLGEQVGVSTNWLGQDAHFNLPGRGGNDGAYFDRIQLFRNTTNEFAVFYAIKEVANPGSGRTVYVLDNVTDEEILASGAETSGLLPNPSHASGPLWPVAKAYAHPSGRFLYYGIVPMHPYRNGTATVVANASYVSITPSGGVPRERVGQRFIPLATSGGSAITATQAYRICAIGTGAEGDVDLSPDWAEGAYTGFYYEIVDDRDARLVFVSEPGLPSQFDYTRILSVGGDKTDGVQHIWGFRGRRFSISKRNIYIWNNDEFTDDAAIVSHTVVAQEGACGLHAMAETPLGLVYVEQNLGVRLFKGVSNFIGVEPPTALGQDDPSQEFSARTQFQGVDPDYLEKTRVIYDPQKHQVFVSYCPIGGGGMEESLVYDFPSKAWRGPWRTHLTAGFKLLNDGGAEQYVYGDEFGQLLTSDSAALDIVNQFSGQVITGTINVVDNAFTFTATAATFDPNGDKRMVGCPIVFSDGAGNYYTNWIAGFSTNQFQLLYIPSTALQVGWTFQIGAIRWQMKTAWFDGGDRVQPQKFEKLRLGFTRGHTGASTALLGVAVNGGSTYLTEESSETTIDAGASTPDMGDDGTLFNEGRIARNGRAFQVRIRGTSVTGDPQITIAVADIDVHGGA